MPTALAMLISAFKFELAPEVRIHALHGVTHCRPAGLCSLWVGIHAQERVLRRSLPVPAFGSALAALHWLCRGRVPCNLLRWTQDCRQALRLSPCAARRGIWRCHAHSCHSQTLIVGDLTFAGAPGRTAVRALTAGSWQPERACADVPRFNMVSVLRRPRPRAWRSWRQCRARCSSSTACPCCARRAEEGSREG